MSATCDQCYEVMHPTEPGEYAVLLCPLHAEAEAMRDVLKGILAVAGMDFRPGVVDEMALVARPILARIDGDTPDA